MSCELGTAKWGNVVSEETLESGLDTITINIGYGYNAKDNTAREDFIFCETTRHHLSVAPTRSGKGVSLIIPNLLSYPGSCLVIDPKGENAWITADWRRRSGQKVYILDPWGEVNRRYGDLAGVAEKIATFNPLSILDPRSPHYADDLAYLADAVIINQGKDPHWDDSARELVAGLMAYCVESDRATACLPMVRVLLSGGAEEIAGIAKEAQGLGAKSIAARKLGRFQQDGKELSSIISTALTQTAFLDSSALSESLMSTSFSFSDLVTGLATVFLVLPVDKLQTHGRWLRLMISIGIRTVARNIKPLEAPVLFVLDEFGTIGRLSAVAQAYGLMAGLSMCIWAFVQDLVQLKRDYPDDWETFIANSETISFFNPLDQTTCEYFSKMLGLRTVERISVETAERRGGQKGFFGFSGQADESYRSMSDQLFQRPLMMPEELRTSTNEVGYLVGRHLPERFYKLKYYENEELLCRGRPDPHFPEMVSKKKAILEKRRAARLAKTIPDAKAAAAFIQSLGVALKKSGLVTSTWEATWPSGETFSFDQKSLIEYARKAADKAA